MLRIFFSISICITLLSAIDIDITSSSNKVTEKEVTFQVNSMKKNRLNITPENAYKLIRENRVLANRFVKEGMLNNEKKIDIQLQMESAFAKIYLDSKVKSIDLSDDILRSYYLENRDEFRLGDWIGFDYILFDSYDKAEEFYGKYKNELEKIDKNKFDDNTTSPVQYLHQEIVYSALPQSYRIVIDKKNDAQYLTPPQKDDFGYFLLLVKPLTKKQDYIPYEKVKNKIQKKLIGKNRQQIKEELIDEILK